MDSYTTLVKSVSITLSPLDYLKLRFFYQGELEWQLLEDSESDGKDGGDLNILSSHDMATAPLLTREAYMFTQRSGQATQYGVLGRALAIQCVYLFIHVMHAH